VRSDSRNIIVTAAHCMHGTGKGYDFAPGYVNGMTPYGVWHVTAIYGDAQWRRQGEKSTKRDWAFLRVASRHRRGKVVRLQDQTGGNRLGFTVRTGQVVSVPGYVFGTADRPITCRTGTYRHQGYPAFDCGGYQGGVSGSPWLRGHGRHRQVVGIIGGLHQGGCTPATSYSSPLGNPAHRALRRAEHRRPADTFPTPPSDGC
jgi:V8-like Glu-specific endopeptidase